MHAGETLRTFLKENFPSMGGVASSLGMTSQNLNHHLRMETLTSDFLRLLKDRLGVVKNENGFSKMVSNGVLLEQNDFAVMMVPLVNKYAYAGYQAGYGDDEYVEALPKVPMMVDKERKGVYRAFEIRGDSMNNGLVGSIPAT